jgi:Flp pilus assembly protein TadD
MQTRVHRRILSSSTTFSLFCFLTTAAHGAIPRSVQNPQSKPAQGKAQKLQNPLNDLLDEAQAALDKDDFAAAVPPLQKFLAEKPDVAYAHFQLAYAYTGLHQVDEARAEYDKAIALDAKMSAAHLNLGILLLEKDPAAAAVSLRKAVELTPSQSRPRLLLGLALERTGDLPGAADAFAAAVSLDPADAEAQVHLGNVDLRLKIPARLAWPRAEPGRARQARSRRRLPQLSGSRAARYRDAHALRPSPRRQQIV